MTKSWAWMPVHAAALAMLLTGCATRARSQSGTSITSPAPAPSSSPASSQPGRGPSPSAPARDARDPRAHAAIMPLERGARFGYRGTVRWYDSDAKTERVESVSWTMDVVDELSVNGATGWVIRGFLLDLVDLDPAARVPGRWLIIRRENRYYLARESPELAASLAPEPGSLFFELPLAHGQTLCPDSGSAYCWHVSAEGRSFELIYRTSPDHTRYVLTPGKGITEFSYSHHGTTLDVDLTLDMTGPTPAPARP